MRDIAGANLVSAFDLGTWALCALLATAFFLGLCDTPGIIGGIGWIGSAGFTLLLISILRGVAWKLVASPLEPEHAKEFRKVLQAEPDLMAAVMHWLGPETTLRQRDMRLLKSAQRYLEKIDETLPTIEEARQDYLGTFACVGVSNALSVRARTLAGKHVKPWKPGGVPARVLGLLARKQEQYASNRKHVWSEWVSGAVGCYFVLVGLSWLTQAWMGTHVVGIEILQPFGVPGLTLLLLLVSLPVPLATLLAHKRLPLSVRETLELKNKVSTQSGAAGQYLFNLPAGHDWSAHDIHVALELTKENHTVPASHLPGPFFTSTGTTEGPAAIKSKEDTLPPLEVDCPLKAKKPWRGHWGQRLLMPSKTIQSLGDDLLERPGVATGLVVVLTLALFMPVGALLTGFPFFSFAWFCATLLVIAQIEMIRLVAYLNISAPYPREMGTQGMEHLIKLVPGCKPIVLRWAAHPTKLRIIDMRALKKCAHKYGKATETESTPPPDPFNELIHPAQKLRDSVLTTIKSHPPSGAPNEKMQSKARSVGKPLELWGFIDRCSDATWDVFELLTTFFFKLPRTFMLTSAAAVGVVYSAVCGLVWIVSSCWSDATGWEIVFPLGQSGSLILGACLLTLITGLFFLFKRSVAPKGVIEQFAEDHANSIDAGACLDYLGQLPVDRYWTFEDLFLARHLIKREERVNQAGREEMLRARGVGEIISTREAQIGTSHVQAEQLKEATADVEPAAAPSPRRRL